MVTTSQKFGPTVHGTFSLQVPFGGTFNDEDEEGQLAERSQPHGV